MVLFVLLDVVIFILRYYRKNTLLSNVAIASTAGGLPIDEEAR